MLQSQHYTFMHLSVFINLASLSSVFLSDYLIFITLPCVSKPFCSGHTKCQRAFCVCSVSFFTCETQMWVFLFSHRGFSCTRCSYDDHPVQGFLFLQHKFLSMWCLYNARINYQPVWGSLRLAPMKCTIQHCFSINGFLRCKRWKLIEH